MAIAFQCPTCGHRLAAPESKAGKLAVCSKCKARVLIPRSGTGPGTSPGRPVASIGDHDNEVADAALEIIEEPQAKPARQDRTPPPLPVPHLAPVSAALPRRDEEDRPRRRRRDDDDDYDDRPRRSRGRDRDEDLRGFRCPFCACRQPPDIRYKVSTAGWIWFIILFCGVCTIFICWIPLLTLRDEYRVCSECGCKLGG